MEDRARRNCVGALSGLTTTFILTDDGKLSIFLGDHSMLAVWG
jgi:hypothetical protein